MSLGGRTFTPFPKVRWLGVFLDPKLSFRAHVDFWCAKAQVVATHLRRLNPVQRGAAPEPLVRAVESCVVTVATHGAEVWYPGTSRPTSSKQSTKYRSVNGLLEKVDKVVRNAIRAALPAWRRHPPGLDPPRRDQAETLSPITPAGLPPPPPITCCGPIAKRVDRAILPSPRAPRLPSPTSLLAPSGRWTASPYPQSPDTEIPPCLRH